MGIKGVELAVIQFFNANINDKNPCDYNGITLLHIAAKKGNL